MLENYIVGIGASLTVKIISKLFRYFMMNIQEKKDATIKGLQLSLLFIFLIYSYLIFNSEGIHKFILGLFLIITIVGWLYYISTEIHKNSSSIWFRDKDSASDHAREIYSYLDVLYNDAGLFIQQYYDSENTHNNQKSKLLKEKMGEFVPFMSRYKLLVSDKLNVEITAFFDILFNYKRRIEGAVSYNRDEAAYNRWLQINNEFGKTVAPILDDLKRKLKQQ